MPNRRETFLATEPPKAGQACTDKQGVLFRVDFADPSKPDMLAQIFF